MEPVDFHFQPNDLIPNAIWAPQGKTPPERVKELENTKFYMEENEQLCRACGWTKYEELRSSYLPRLRIFHARGNTGLWLMGNDWMLWDRPKGASIGNDYMTYQFLKNQGVKDIPLLKEMKHLGSIWHRLSPEEKQGYAKQVTAALRELRQFTSPVPQRVDGSPLWDNVIAQCHPPAKCKNIGKTTEEWFHDIAEELRCGLSRDLKTKDEGIIEAKLQELKDNFPDGAPFVLTHADLNFSNIIVNNGKIEAIIDWEIAGYYPWWVERWTSRHRGDTDSNELFDIVWAELCPEINDTEFYHKVGKCIRPVQDAWSSCPIKHTESRDVWRRPAFCECKPYGGAIYKREWGAELKHSVDYEKYAANGYEL